MATARVLDELRLLAERRHRDPKTTLDRAVELLDQGGDQRIEASAHRVIGLALHELNRFDEAVASYRMSIEVSRRHALADTEALARANLSMSLLNLGDMVAAEDEVAQARALATTATRGFVEMLYGTTRARAGKLDEALSAFQQARRWLIQPADLSALALLHLNRGIVLAWRNDPVPALRDLAEAERISTERGLPVLVAMATHNSGFVQCRRGDLPEALAAYARAERAYASVDNPRLMGLLQADRCEVLLLAGLVAEALADAVAAVEALGSTGDLAGQTECRLLLARAHLAAGDHTSARTEATTAARQFLSSRRRPWAALGRYIAVQAEILAIQDGEEPPPIRLLHSCRRIAAVLEAQRWPLEAVQVRTFIGRMALALGRPDAAREELARAAGARTGGPADLRAQAWLATALLRLAEGDRPGAKRALARGMNVVDEYQATLGATEMRARAAGHGADLARLGTRLALEDRNAVQMLRWAERWRAGALRRPPVRPPDDAELADALTELRRVRSDLRDSALRGGGVPALEKRAAALEEVVRSRTLQAKGDTAATGRIDVGALRQAVGDRVLVEYVAVDGWLYAIIVSGRAVRLHTLAPTADVAREKQYLLFAMRRLLWTPIPGPAADSLSYSATRLDELLLAPLKLPAGTPLVVVPTGVLHGLPWSTLATIAGRDTTVAPSSALWLGAARRRPVPAAPQVALVAGPGLPGADAECRAVSHLYPGASLLVGDRATAENVLAALEAADLVHIAAHGRFRADSPLFSSLLLTDGPLTIYDLERLRSVAGTVILAACDAAVASVGVGDEPLGTAAALIGLGVRSVIAPVMAVPDGETATFMVALHRRLQAGDRPSAALAAASSGQHRAAASAFVCVGCRIAADQPPGPAG